MVTIPRAAGLALLLTLASGPVVSDAGVACHQGGGAAHVRCRRRVVADLRRARRSCAALVRDLMFDRNTFVTSRSGLTLVGGFVTTSGTVSGSQVDGVGGSGNVAGGGGSVGVFSTNQLLVSGAPPESVQGNSVSGIGIG